MPKPEPDSFLQAIAETIARHAMLAPGERVLAAVSGGADSVALLLALHRLGYRVTAAHFDHQTRNGASARDACFVESLTDSLALPCVMASEPIAAEAAQQGLNFEVHARAHRYAFLLRAAREANCTAIATGHHADDQAETLLMRLLQGTSLRGLAGIAPVRMQSGPRILRPLLHQSRAAILDWLRVQGQDWCEDATNAELHPLRNRIRHCLLPELAESYNPRIGEALSRLADSLRRDNDYLEAAAQAALARVQAPLGLDRAAFREEAPALQFRLLAEWCHGLGVHRLSAERLEALRAALLDPEATGQTLDIAEGVQVHIGRRHAQFLADRAAAYESADTLPLPVPGETTAFGRRWRTRIITTLPAKSPAAYCHAHRQVIDADRVDRPLSLRYWRPGDRFQPLGMSGSRKLSDYFQERGLPAPKRKRALLLCMGDTVLWVVGGQPAATAAGTPTTQRWLVVEILEEINAPVGTSPD